MGEFYTSRDPATFQQVGRLELLGNTEILEGFQRAKKALESWKNTPLSTRIAFIRPLAQYLTEIADALSLLLAKESGRVKTEAYFSEILPVIEAVPLYCKEIRKAHSPQKPSVGFFENWGRSSTLYPQPKGVLALFSHWSSPIALPMSVLIPALLAGCTVLYKPSERTPLVGQRIVQIFQTLGIPEEVLIFLPSTEEGGRYLAQFPLNHLFFFGHPEAAKAVLKLASEKGTPVTALTTGNDAMWVREDADIDSASSAALWGAFAYSGQQIGSIKRCYVAQSIAEKFRNQCKEKTYALEQKSGHHLGADLSSMISEKQQQILAAFVKKALEAGAEVVLGGEAFQKEGAGYFYAPTLLYQVPPNHEILHEVVYGPLLWIIPVESEEQALRGINQSPYGMTVSLWTSDLRYGHQFAQKLEVGTVYLNEVTRCTGMLLLPLQGLKQSGLGVLGGSSLFQPFLFFQHLHENKSSKLKAFWWFPYDEKTLLLGEGFSQYLGFSSWKKRLKALWKIVQNLNFEDKR
jgi:acyl-CoA reductase-like NAD-dependent aldehyde dehydrogenase